MKAICLYFQIHQPYRLRTYRFFDIGGDHNYYDDYQNRFIMQRVANESYLPTNQILLDLINQYGEDFKISFSISGMALDQLEQYSPEVIESFQKLAKTGCVEFCAETYAHSLSALKNKEEFNRQVEKHANKIESLFGVKPTCFRNTELIYSNEIGKMAFDIGYKTVLAEGAKHILGWKSPNYVYKNVEQPDQKLLLRNFSLSDDIELRFHNQNWEGWPLTADKLASWINNLDENQEIVNLFMNYETFGERQKQDSGIFDFLKALPQAFFNASCGEFKTISEAANLLEASDTIDVPYPTSWADEERDLSAWLGNELQDEAFNKLYDIRSKLKNCEDQNLMNDWERLQTSNHFYYMCTKWFSDDDPHKLFNPYPSPYEAFINFMNILADFKIRVESYSKEKTTIFTVDGSELKNDIISAGKDVLDNISDIIKKKKGVKETRKAKKKDITLLEFDDVLDFSATKIKHLLTKVDIENFAVAIHDKGEDIVNKVTKNLGKKAKKQFEESRATLKKVRKVDIKAATEKFLDEIKDQLS